MVILLIATQLFFVLLAVLFLKNCWDKEVRNTK